MPSYNTEVTRTYADALGKLLRPDQTIAFDKLLKQSISAYPKLFDGTDGANRERAYCGVRDLIKRGFMSRKLRHGAPALLTFHNPPLDKPQRSLTRNAPTPASNGLSPPKAGDADRLERLIARLRKKEADLTALNEQVAAIKADIAKLLTG